MECVTKCEFQEFFGDKFGCKLYDMILDANYDHETNKLEVLRCQKCIDEGTIGTNTKEEYVRKIKQHLGWMGDLFYSFKDDFEEELTHMYRLVKELEEDETIHFCETTRDSRRRTNEEVEEV